MLCPLAWGQLICMTETGGQLVLMPIMVTAAGRAISGCVLAVAYADIYGALLSYETAPRFLQLTLF